MKQKGDCINAFGVIRHQPTIDFYSTFAIISTLNKIYIYFQKVKNK